MARLVQALGTKPADLSISCMGRENKNALHVPPQHTIYIHHLKIIIIKFKKKINH